MAMLRNAHAKQFFLIAAGKSGRKCKQAKNVKNLIGTQAEKRPKVIVVATTAFVW